MSYEKRIYNKNVEFKDFNSYLRCKIEYIESLYEDMNKEYSEMDFLSFLESRKSVYDIAIKNVLTEDVPIAQGAGANSFFYSYWTGHSPMVTADTSPFCTYSPSGTFTVIDNSSANVNYYIFHENDLLDISHSEFKPKNKIEERKSLKRKKEISRFDLMDLD